MTKAERIGFLKMIKEDIHVCSLDANFYEIMKECALSETICELEKSVDDAPTVNAVSEEVYTREYNLRKETEMKEYKLKKAIDEIKAEIIDEADFAYADFDRYKEEVLGVESDELPDDDFRYGLERAFEIINRKVKENTDAT